MSLSILLSGFGVAGVAIGGLLAARSDYSEAHKALQRAAGLLLIAGFACIGAAFSLVFGPPLP